MSRLPLISFLDEWRQSLSGDGKGRILIAISTGWFLSIGVRLIYPVLLPYIREDYGFNLTIAGLLLTTLWMAYAIGQLPAGYLSDKIGEGMTLIISTLLSAGTLLGVMISHTPETLFAATIGFGFATALYGVARFTALSKLFPENNGAAIGFNLASGDFGNAILPPIAGFIAVSLGWHFGIGFIVPIFLLTAVVLWRVIPNPSATDGASDSFSLDRLRYLLRAFRSPSLIAITTLQILAYCVWQSFTGFYPTYLIEIKGISTGYATLLYGGFFALGSVLKASTGRLYDTFGIQRSLPALMAIIATSLVALVFVNGPLLIALVTVPLAGILGYGSMTLPYMTTALPEDMKGIGLGSLRTLYMTIGAGAPVVFGAFANWGYFNEAFFILATVAALTIPLAYRLPAVE